MSHFTGRVTKRYGATEKAHVIFLQEAAKCDPLLDDEELDKDAFPLNGLDGTYDLRQGMTERRDHEPADLITKNHSCSSGR